MCFLKTNISGFLWFLISIDIIAAGKWDGMFPDDSFVDTGEIDVGRKTSQKIPPGIFWRSQVFIDHPMYLKFNVSLGKDALVGIYGRRGLPPSHTQVTIHCFEPLHMVTDLSTLNYRVSGSSFHLMQ